MIKVLKVSLVIILLAIIALFVWRFMPQNPQTEIKVNPTPIPVDNGAEEWIGEGETEHLKPATEEIAIPGFDSLVFKAGEKVQKVNFRNPDTNNCYFQMSLLIDNVEYWKSGNVEPGKCYYRIELNNALEAGDYDGCLAIKCITEQGVELNGANVRFTLTVQ